MFRFLVRGSGEPSPLQHRGKPLTSSLRAKKPIAKPEVSDQIGRQLRTVYNDILSQPVPDRFMDLLKDLDGLAPAASLAQPAAKVGE